MGLFSAFKHIASPTVEELSERREQVRQELCNYGGDDKKADRLQRELNIIDYQLRKLDPREDVDPDRLPKREHGWYVYKKNE